MKALRILALTTLCAAFAGATPIIQDVTLGPSTSLNTSASFKPFNPALGTLQQVILTITAYIDGSVQAENMGAAAPVTLTLSALVNATGPDGVVVQLNPATSVNRNLAAFDGSSDFGGTSGVTIAGLSDSKSTSKTFTDAVLLALFEGSGNILIPVNAMNLSNASGSGNLATIFSTTTRVDFRLEYDYEPSQVPEPATVGMMLPAGLVLLMLPGLRRRFSR